MLPNISLELKKKEAIEEYSGNLSRQKEEDKLMKSVLENNKKVIEKGMLLNQALNNNIDSFIPDLMFKQFVSNYSLAEKLYGKSLIKLISGYNPNFIEKNISIPEFRRELKENISNSIEEMREDGLVNSDGSISDSGIKLASLILYTEELDNIIPKGIYGERIYKKEFIYGIKDNIKDYRKGDRYRDIAIRKSIKLSIRRCHGKLLMKDMKTFERQSKGEINIIYGLDASGSMKGKKIEMCKKAGIALAYKAINEKDKVGLIVFGSDVKEYLSPTSDFIGLLDKITRIKASRETNIASTIMKSIELFTSKDATKHLLLITDAMPTKGKDPEKETLEAISEARNKSITVSVIGVQLDAKSKKFAEKIANLGQGRLYLVRNTENLDILALEDYYGIA